jgi:hypothetical protein
MSLSVAINSNICARWSANKLIGNYKSITKLQIHKTCTAIDNEANVFSALTPDHWRNFILAMESAGGGEARRHRRREHNRMIIKY